jgi:hypothetical protein
MLFFFNLNYFFSLQRCPWLAVCLNTCQRLGGGVGWRGVGEEMLAVVAKEGVLAL